MQLFYCFVEFIFCSRGKGINNFPNFQFFLEFFCVLL